MGKNKKEKFIFTLIVCAMMVLGMSFYNVILAAGFTNALPAQILSGYLPIFLVALIIDWFLVGRVAKNIVKNVLDNKTPLIHRILLTSTLMVLGMCFSMSLFTSILHNGLSTESPTIFVSTFLRNIIVALPLQLLIVGPAARGIFFKLYPVKA